MKIKLKVKAEGTYEIDTNDFTDEWQEHCDDEGSVEEGNDYPEVPKKFAIERFTTAVEEGNVELSEVLEDASIEIEEKK
jgi:hypothetical protein